MSFKPVKLWASGFCGCTLYTLRGAQRLNLECFMKGAVVAEAGS